MSDYEKDKKVIQLVVDNKESSKKSFFDELVKFLENYIEENPDKLTMIEILGSFEYLKMFLDLES